MARAIPLDLDAIDPRRLGFALGEAIDSDLMARLTQHRRIARTVRGRIVDRYGEAAEPAAWMRDEGDREAVVLRAGAAFNARGLRQIVDGAALRILNAALGARIVAYGMHYGTDARPLDVDTSPPTPAAIRADGEACLAAWRDRCLADDAGAAVALTLLMPPGWFARRPRTPAHREHGAGLVDDAIAALAAESDHEEPDDG